MPVNYPTFEALRSSLNYLAQKKFEREQDLVEQEFKFGLIQFQEERAGERAGAAATARREAAEISATAKTAAAGTLAGAKVTAASEVYRRQQERDKTQQEYELIQIAAREAGREEKPALTASFIVNVMQRLEVGQGLDMEDPGMKALVEIWPGIGSGTINVAEKMIALKEIGVRDFPEDRALFESLAKKYMLSEEDKWMFGNSILPTTTAPLSDLENALRD